ncbi:MAG: hypothetical protein QM679_01075 [Patulibacter sp.]
MSLTPKPNRRVTALATLAFAGAMAAPSGSDAAADSAPRTSGPALRLSAPETTVERPAASAATRLDLPSGLDLDALAAMLGVHRGRLESAVRRLVPDASRSIGGLDPMTALAQQLGVPETDVYLAVARLAAQH